MNEILISHVSECSRRQLAGLLLNFRLVLRECNLGENPEGSECIIEFSYKNMKTWMDIIS